MFDLKYKANALTIRFLHVHFCRTCSWNVFVCFSVTICKLRSLSSQFRLYPLFRLLRLMHFWSLELHAVKTDTQSFCAQFKVTNISHSCQLPLIWSAALLFYILGLFIMIITGCHLDNTSWLSVFMICDSYAILVNIIEAALLLSFNWFYLKYEVNGNYVNCH